MRERGHAFGHRSRTHLDGLRSLLLHPPQVRHRGQLQLKDGGLLIRARRRTRSVSEAHMRHTAHAADGPCKVCEQPAIAQQCAPGPCKVWEKWINAAHHQRSMCSSENVGRSLIKSGVEHQPSMILTATWCLRIWEQATLMLMRHGMRDTYVREQSGHFARVCGVRMWHTAAEHTEIRRTIPTSSAERPTCQGWCGSPCCRNLALPVSARCAVSMATRLPQCRRRTEPTVWTAW